MSWSPDNESLTFISNRAGRANQFELWTKRADGTGAAELLLSRGLPIFESLYSSDERWLVFREGGTISGAGDIFAIQLGVDSAAVPLVATEFNERSPALSADGRWLAYTSGASGRSEIYVRPFPEVGSALVQVSTDGGTEPIWAHSGRELFYRSASGLVAVEVATEQSVFVAGRQEVLFSLGGWGGYLNGSGHRLYDLTPDDRRFVFLRIGDSQFGELIVVENWFEELRERVGN